MESKNKKWTDSKTWLMGILSALIIAAITAFFTSINAGQVKLIVANDKTVNGRCIDRELFLINETKKEAEDIIISFDVDHFTRNGDLQIEYGVKEKHL